VIWIFILTDEKIHFKGWVYLFLSVFLLGFISGNNHKKYSKEIMQVKRKLKKLISMMLAILIMIGMAATNFGTTSVFADNDTEEYGVYDATKQRKVENKNHETVANFSLCMDYDLKSPGTSTSATFNYKRVDNVNENTYSQYRKKVGSGNFSSIKRILYYYLTHPNDIVYGVLQNEYYYQDTKNNYYDTNYSAYPEHNNQKNLLRRAAEDSSLDDEIDNNLLLTIYYYNNGGRGFQNVITGNIKEKPKAHDRSKTINVEGTKTWDDNNNQDGKRPTEIKVNLMKQVGDGEITKYETKTVTADNQGNWKWLWENLPEYEDGKKITYSITEDAIDGYTSSIEGYNITNTHKPEKINIEGSKTWKDSDNQDGKRPGRIIINLTKWLKNGMIVELVEEKFVTEADGWKWKFENLDKYQDGEEIKYTISEGMVPEYDCEINGYDVTNFYTPEKTVVEGSKTWEDNNNQAKRRPKEITINLLKNGEKIDSKIVKETDDWKWKFDNLDKYEKGKEIKYTISEEKVDGYISEVDGYNVKNTYVPSKTSVQVMKTWVDADNQDGKRPNSITVKLLADDKEVKTLVLTKEDNWVGTFTDLDEYEDGKKINYTIKEEKVDGYSSMITGDAKNGYKIINTKDVTPAPEIPENPSNPRHKKPDVPNTKSPKTTPNTGDSSDIVLFAGLLALSAGALSTLVVYKRRKARE